MTDKYKHVNDVVNSNAILNLATEIYLAHVAAGDKNCDTDRCVELALALMKKSREEAEKL